MGGHGGRARPYGESVLLSMPVICLTVSLSVNSFISKQKQVDGVFATFTFGT